MTMRAFARTRDALAAAEKRDDGSAQAIVNTPLGGLLFDLQAERGRT